MTEGVVVKSDRKEEGIYLYTTIVSPPSLLRLTQPLVPCCGFFGDETFAFEFWTPCDLPKAYNSSVTS
jgi:hypothetical protein